MRSLIIVCLLAFLGSTIAYKSYDGYQVLRTAPLLARDVEKVAALTTNINYDFWSSPGVGNPVDIMTSSEHLKELRGALASLGITNEIIIPDVGTTIKREREENEARKHMSKSGRAPDLTRFLTFDEIQAYLDEVVAAFPSIASIINIGSSYEGRPMRVLKLSNGPGKAGIFFEAAIHAREWMGPPVVLHTINELTENLAANQAMLDRNDFYFLPVANPDGYTFTFTDDRLWRKTRSPNAGSICIGTDPNRNFDWDWAGGGVPSACSDTYPGTAAFSESESKAIGDFLQATTSITFYVAIHSYGQYLLHSWGNTVVPPSNVAELQAVGQDALDALTAVYGTRYTMGSIANVLYFAYGGSIDWTLGALQLMYSYAIELPGGGSDGFNPPPSDIAPVTTETWEAIKVFAANIPAARG